MNTRVHAPPKASQVWEQYMDGETVALGLLLPDDDPMRQFALDATTLALEAINVMVARQRDYGPYNISKMGDAGLLVRLNDKLERVLNLALSGADATSESVDDSDIDISNYALIRRMGRRGLWPTPFRNVRLLMGEDIAAPEPRPVPVCRECGELVVPVIRGGLRCPTCDAFYDVNETLPVGPWKPGDGS